LADFAVVGGGFTGLAAAAWFAKLAPAHSVVVLEASRIGSGASGRTGGMVLSETAAGDQPGLGDVLGGFAKILGELYVDCELSLPGAWEIAREGGAAHSAIDWQDAGNLRVIREMPGGTLDPGKLVAGLARAAESAGAIICEHCAVERIDWGDPPRLGTKQGTIHAKKVLFASNAFSLGLARLASRTHPRLTLAVVSAPLSEKTLEEAGLGQRKPFYTVDFPYLWGRVRSDNSVIWGSGLVSPSDASDIEKVDVSAPEPQKMFRSLEGRVRGLHPILRDVSFTHRWGGPILFRDSWTPVFGWHPQSDHGRREAIVLGAYAGHGVALSVYLGAWAAEALAGRRELPRWGKSD
jgi:glycine/D-amino acid oxidase-like deaminating enzyme